MLKVPIDIPSAVITAMLWQLVSMSICTQIGAEQQHTEMGCLAQTSSVEISMAVAGVSSASACLHDIV